LQAAGFDAEDPVFELGDALAPPPELEAGAAPPPQARSAAQAMGRRAVVKRTAVKAIGLRPATGNPSRLDALEDLEANSATNDKRIVRVAPTCRLGGDPRRAPDEAQVLPEVLPECGQALERNEMPEAAAAPPFK
jgi:hypothetical protein